MNTLGPFMWTQLKGGAADSIIYKACGANVSRLPNTLWFLVVDEHGEVCACGGYNPVRQELGPSYVSPDYRGRNLQARLIEARAAYAFMHGASVVSTIVDAENKYSLRNLLNCGFTIVEVDESTGELTLEKNGAIKK